MNRTPNVVVRYAAVFFVTMAVSASLTIGAAWASAQFSAGSTPARGVGPMFSLDRRAPEAVAEPIQPAQAAAFQVTASAIQPPAPVPTLAPTAVQAVSEAIEPNIVTASLRQYTPDWWNASGEPRVPFISQFDGGPLQGYNCTLASGAMLARLGFGIVTSGSELRQFQDQSSGGTTLGDLQQALHNRFGADIQRGLLTPAQLRQLLRAGWGAVVQGTYGVLPPTLSLEPSFHAGHAVYVDGYVPPSGGVEGAFYVMDPIGQLGAYDGAWWPEHVLADFATAFSGTDGILTAWVHPGSPFSGGVVPTPSPAAGSSAPATEAPSPSGSESPAPSPSESPAPSPSESPSASPSQAPVASPSTAVPTASPTATPTPIPLPSFSFIPLPTFTFLPDLNIASGDTPVPIPPVKHFLGQTATIGGLTVFPFLEACLAASPPAGCPVGVPALLDKVQFLTSLAPGTGTAPQLAVADPGAFDRLLRATNADAPALSVLSVDATRPGSVVVLYRAAPGTTSKVWYWAASGSGALESVPPVATINVDGGPASVATLSVAAKAAYRFQVAVDDGVSVGLSQVGQFTTGPGATRFSVTLASVNAPAAGQGPAAGGPYTPVTDAQPAAVLQKCLQSAAGTPGAAQCEVAPPAPGTPAGALDPAVTVTCRQLVSYDGSTWCLGRNPGAGGPAAAATCQAARVTYELTGVDATGVIVRALPAGRATIVGSGVLTLAPGLETSGPSGSGSVTLGCLSSGIRYAVTIDAVGDDGGVLTAVPLDVP